MGPRVHTNLMTSHVFLDQHLRTFNDARADHEESRLDVLRAQVVDEFPARVVKKRSITMPSICAWQQKLK